MAHQSAGFMAGPGKAHLIHKMSAPLYRSAAHVISTLTVVYLSGQPLHRSQAVAGMTKAFPTITKEDAAAILAGELRFQAEGECLFCDNPEGA